MSTCLPTNFHFKSFMFVSCVCGCVGNTKKPSTSKPNRTAVKGMWALCAILNRPKRWSSFGTMARRPTIAAPVRMTCACWTVHRPASSTKAQCVIPVASSQSSVFDGSAASVRTMTCARFAITATSIICDIVFVEYRRQAVKGICWSRDVNQRK